MTTGSSNRYRLVESVYQKAVEMPTEGRAAFLSSECAGDESLRHDVETLLEHFERATPNFLDSPVHNLSSRFDPQIALPNRIGVYKIIRLLGRGGMGAVYEAEQIRPRRRVALKVIRNDARSEETLRRFRHEADVLGQLQHPGIAQIYEFGVADVYYNEVPTHQQPYFAMELVTGASLADFVANGRLDREALLELIAQICDAVHHAHQKGVIHRDLKPSNVVVDQDGRPRVLDFGVARVTQADAQTMSAHTGAGQLVGTVPYMSPEQLAGDPRAIDTRSDVYSLGVVAYELLTGRLPFDVAGLGAPQAVRVLSDRDATPAGTACPDLRGDIEAILAKALERDQQRRYGSAAELATDIRRHLRHETVSAHPPGAMYHLSRFVRRNRGLVGAVTLAIVALVTGTIATAWFAWRASDQAERAQVQAARATEVIRFLREMLGSADPTALRGKDVTVRQMLDEAAQRIDSGDMARQPEVEAALRTTVGETYLSLGQFAAAKRHLEGGLAILNQLPEVSATEIAQYTNLLARALDGLAEFSEAERLHRTALATVRRELGEEHILVARIGSDLGNSLHLAGNLAEAEVAHREALTQFERLPDATPLDIARSLTHLGTLTDARGKLAEAEPLLRNALEIRCTHLPHEHPDLARALSNLGWLLWRRANDREAEPLLREALAIYRQTLDPLHPDLAQCLNNLGMVVKRGTNPEAVTLLREALHIRTEALSPNHPDVAESLIHLAHALDGVGQYDEANRLSARALEVMRAAFGERHQKYAFALHDAAVHRTMRGDPQGAEPLLRETLDILLERLGPDHDLVAHVRDSLGAILCRLERFDEALVQLEMALAQRLELLGENHGKVGITYGTLAEARLRTGDAAGARDAALNCISILRPDGGSLINFSSALLMLVEARLSLGEPMDDAETTSAAQEALALRTQLFGESSWQFADAQRVCALRLARLQRFAESEAALQCAFGALDTDTRTAHLQYQQARRRATEARDVVAQAWGQVGAGGAR